MLQIQTEFQETIYYRSKNYGNLAFFCFFFHHSACQKCFFTAKCSPSQGVPSPLERPNIRDQTCPKIKCKIRCKQALVTKNTSPA